MSQWWSHSPSPRPKSRTVRSYSLSPGSLAFQCAAFLPACVSLKFWMFPSGWGVESISEWGHQQRSPKAYQGPTTEPQHSEVGKHHWSLRDRPNLL